ncbi:MAG: class I SAM-dependent methyltransferase [Anaerolineae bacterium]|nr:class I SAM-dependent methyltransferase [Anaerolineae bacterium]
MSQQIDKRETARTEARYDRIAPIYDLMEVLPERQFRSWREKLWAQVPKGRVLEVGVGTGKNFPYHLPDLNVVGIDISERMLDQARQRAEELGHPVELHQMDAQQLDFPDDVFDAAVATFVFCSVPDAVQGLRELGRVVKPGGKIFLLEHVRINEPEILGKVMDLLDPLVLRLMGPHINRRTEENVRRAGLEVARVESLAAMDLVKLIVAKPARASHGRQLNNNRYEGDGREEAIFEEGCMDA